MTNHKIIITLEDGKLNVITDCDARKTARILMYALYDATAAYVEGEVSE